jgi:hypothetical protein
LYTRDVNVWQKVRKWLKSGAEDAGSVAAARRLEEDKLTVRVSQWGRQPYSNIPPTPDVLDPDREHR